MSDLPPGRVRCAECGTLCMGDDDGREKFCPEHADAGPRHGAEYRRQGVDAQRASERRSLLLQGRGGEGWA